MLGGAGARSRSVSRFTTCRELEDALGLERGPVDSLSGSTAKAESDGELNGPIPAELLAATRNSYSVPSISRVTWERDRGEGRSPVVSPVASCGAEAWKRCHNDGDGLKADLVLPALDTPFGDGHLVDSGPVVSPFLPLLQPIADNH